MAEVITRFKLETTQYESKLRDASKALAEYSNQAELAGKDFEKFTATSADAARALGQQAGGATTAKEKVRELVQAYNEVARAYNKLTDDQKKSTFGKAMAESLRTLQGRISDAKRELYSMGQETSNAGGFLSSLADKVTLNIDVFKLLEVGLAAGKAALTVAKDAFFASEATVDEWGRTMAASESLYTGFLTALNNSDVSGFLGRIDEIVGAARRAYDELDRLGTMKTIQSPAMSAQETENQRMRTMLMTGRYIAPTGMKAATGMKNGDLLSKDQLRAIEQHLQRGMDTIVGLTKNELNQTGKAIDAYYDKIAKENGMTMAEFRKGVSSMSEFDRLTSLGQKYVDWERQHTANVVSAQTGGTISMRTTSERNPYEAYKQWSTFRVDKQGDGSYNALVNLIKQRDQQMSQMYSTMGQAYRTINRVEGVTPRSIMGGGGGGGGRGGGGSAAMVEGGIKAGAGFESLAVGAGQTYESMASLRQRLAEYERALANATNIVDEMNARQGIADTKWAMSDVGRQAVKLGLDKSAFEELQEEINEGIGKMELKPLVIEPVSEEDMTKSRALAKEGDDTAKAWQNAASAVGSVGSALQSIEDPGAKVAGIIAQAVANIAATFAASLKGTFETWDWIAAAAAGTATMVSTIRAIKSATAGCYANGGVIGGSSYSGDQQVAMVNAGEVILNRAQQGNLAQQLSDGSGGGGMRPSWISGEQIYVAMNRYTRRTGKGEIVTWK